MSTAYWRVARLTPCVSCIFAIFQYWFHAVPTRLKSLKSIPYSSSISLISGSVHEVDKCSTEIGLEISKIPSVFFLSLYSYFVSHYFTTVAFVTNKVSYACTAFHKVIRLLIITSFFCSVLTSSVTIRTTIFFSHRETCWLSKLQFDCLPSHIFFYCYRGNFFLS